MKAKPKDEDWSWLMARIKELWEAKKKRPLMFSKQDGKLLKTMRQWFTVYELAALYDLYLRKSPFWGPKTGYLVGGMFQERAVLSDDPNFKPLAVKYEDQSGLASQTNLLSQLGLQSKGVIS